MRRYALLLILQYCPYMLAAADIATDVRFVPRPPKPPRKVIFPQPAAQPPKLDGKIDDACWKAAVVLKDFVDHTSGMPAEEQSVAWITYDAGHIYVAVQAGENQLDQIEPRTRKRGNDVWPGDSIEVHLDPKLDGTTYYQFVTGAHGEKFDLKGGVGAGYDAEWNVAVTRGPKVIYAEFAIPLKAIEEERIPPDSVWRFNISRTNTATEAGWFELSQWSKTESGFANVNFFADMSFLPRDRYGKRVLPAYVKVVVDREEYDAIDPFGQGIVTVQPGNRPLKDLGVTLSLSHDGKPVGEQKIEPLESTLVRFLMPMKAIAAGNYRLEATLLHAGKRLAVSERAFRKTAVNPTAGARRSGTIDLKLPPQNLMPNASWPVRTGVPFPKGVLLDPKRLRLRYNRKDVPFQAEVRSRWNPKGSVRWLGLTFVADYRNGRPGTCTLQYKAGAPKVASAMQVTENDDELTVTTGKVRFVVRKRSYDGIHAAWVDANSDGKYAADEQVVAGGPEHAPYVVDLAGKTYRTDRDRDVTVRVEQAGPAHAVVAVDGWFVGEDGARLCKHTTYCEAFTGLPYVFVNHTMVVTYDTRKNRLKDCGFPIAVQGDRYAFGVDDGAVSGSRGKRVTLVQNRWDHCSTSGGDATYSGKQAAGWADAGTETTGVTASLQYMWQRYPKEFSVDAKRMVIHSWPRDLGDTFSNEEELARPNVYKMFFAHEGPALDLRMPQRYLDRVLEIRKKESFYTVYAKAGMKANGMGVALCSNYMLHFRGGPLDPQTETNRARLFEKDPHALADSRWIADTGVFGPLEGDPKKQIPQLSKILAPSIVNFAKQQESNAEYGQWIWGDVHTYWRFHQGYAGLHRVWLSHHYQQNRAPWFAYVRTGDTSLIDWARINNHLTMNVEICHYDDPDIKLPYVKRGLVYHVKGFVPWGGDGSLAAHLTPVDYLLFNWFLTGNRRARDVAREWQEGVIKDSPLSSTGRDTATPLGEFVEYYRNGFDPGMLELMDRYQQTLFKMPGAEQHAANWNALTYQRFYDFTKSRKALKWLEEWATKTKYRPIVGHLYLVTKNKDYITKGLEGLHSSLYSVDDDPESDTYGIWIPAWMNLVREIHGALIMEKALSAASEAVKWTFPSKPLALRTGTTEQSFGYTMLLRKEATKPLRIEALTAGSELVVKGPDGKVAGEGASDKKNESPAKIMIPATSPAGVYTAAVTGRRFYPAPQSDALGQIFPLEKGKVYCMNTNQAYIVAPAKGKGPVTLTVWSRKHATDFQILDMDGNIVARQNSMWATRRTLVVPAEGGPYRLLCSRVGYVTAEQDAVMALTPETLFQP